MNIKGFRFSAVEAAIKKPGRKDLALICSDVPADACAVFTVSTVKAAPVLLSMNVSRAARPAPWWSTAEMPMPAPASRVWLWPGV